MVNPNFFIVGAMKAGTSSLHAILQMHPEIFMSNPKEPSFFVDNKDLQKLWPQIARENFSHKKEEYLSLFKDGAGKKIIGESSSNYTKIPYANDVTTRIYRFNKHSKILYIMRDPIERTISHYWHAVRRAEGETSSLLDAIKKNRHYINVSNYAMQIKPYINLYGKENVKCITLENFSKNPESEIQNILSWLEVSQDFTTPLLETKLHVTNTVVEQTRYSYFVHVDNDGIRRILKMIFPLFVRKAGRALIRKKIDRTKIDLKEAKEYLRPIFMPMVEELSVLLNTEYKEWPNYYSN